MAAKSLWFDVRVNGICVKFRFTGSGFWAPNEQNAFSRILTKECVIWENDLQHVSLLIKRYRWAKNERNSNYELVPQKVDFGRYLQTVALNNYSTNAHKISSNLPDLILLEQTGKDKRLPLFTCHTSIKIVNAWTDLPGLDEWKTKIL